MTNEYITKPLIPKWGRSKVDKKLKPIEDVELPKMAGTPSGQLPVRGTDPKPSNTPSGGQSGKGDPRTR